MVEIINKSVCRGVAGRRIGKVKGVVIHNDAGSIHATAKAYLSSLGTMSNAQLANGFAHYYIDRNTIVRTEDTYNMAWHTANSDGNANYIGYEVCQSYGASDKDFLANEQMVFKQVAEDLKFYGLPADRNTVRLHREFVATACPHRSWDLHGKSVNAVKDYFIKEIKKYMNGGTTVSKPQEKNYYQSGNYFEALQDLKTYNKAYSKVDNTWFFKKGSKFAVREIVKMPNGATHAQVAGLGNTYVTLSKKHVKPQ